MFLLRSVELPCADMLEISFEVPWPCPRCKQPLALNAATERVFCHGCQTVSDTPPAFWTDILSDAVGYALNFKDGQLMTMSIMNRWGILSLKYGRPGVSCAPPCGAALPLAKVDQGLRSGSPVPCDGCKATLALRRAPDWFSAAVHPRIVGLAGEGPVPDRPPPPTAPNALRFHCYSCGAPVPLSGGTRQVKCPHCATDLVIPDALWARLHPASTLSRWFALVS